jgi:hypothetical protein
VVVTGTPGDDSVAVSGDTAGLTASGLAAAFALTGAERSDRVEIDTLTGNDNVDFSGLAQGVIQLFVNGTHA